jgi:hypothetical protein
MIRIRLRGQEESHTLHVSAHGGIMADMVGRRESYNGIQQFKVLGVQRSHAIFVGRVNGGTHAQENFDY